MVGQRERRRRSGARAQRALAVVAFAAGALHGVGCRGPSLPAGSHDPIRVGVVLTFDLDGMAYAEAIELATREANSVGGPLPGRPVELLVAESMNDPERARTEAQRLVDAGAVAILGDGGSTNTLAIAMEVTTPGRVPHLSCSATSPTLTDHNRFLAMNDRFFFRTAPPDSLQAVALANVAATDAGCASVAILHQSDDYGTPMATLLGEELASRSISVTAVVPYEYGRASYDAEVATAIGSAPGCVAILGYPAEAGLIVRSWETQSGPRVTWIGSDALLSPMFVLEAGSAARVDGFLGTAPQTAPETPDYTSFRDRYRATFARGASFEPEAYTANCYDAAALLYLAIAQAGTTDGDEVRDALLRVSRTSTGAPTAPTELAVGFERVRRGREINYEGASGPVDFDLEGDVVSNYVVWRFRASDQTFPVVRTILASTL